MILPKNYLDFTIKLSKLKKKIIRVPPYDFEFRAKFGLLGKIWTFGQKWGGVHFLFLLQIIYSGKSTVHLKYNERVLMLKLLGTIVKLLHTIHSLLNASRL